MSQPKLEGFDTAIVDVDSLIYSITWVMPNARTAEKTLINSVEQIIEDMEVEDAYVFVKGKDNFRFNVDIDYKANRRKMVDPEIQDRVEELYAFAQSEFISADGGEADDYCSIYAYQALEEGRRPVVAHIDKDLNMIPGWHWNFKKKNLYYTSPQDSFVFMSRQLLTGDAADNIPGLKGVGDVTAGQFLQNKFLHEMKDRILEKWRTHTTGGKIQWPNWEDRFFKSANCLILRESLEELRPFTKDEVLKKMTWNLTEERFMVGITENEDLAVNNGKTTPYSLKKDPDKSYVKAPKECETSVIGSTVKPSNLKKTTDSSTVSTQSSPASTTSAKSPSTSTRKRKGLVARTGEPTRRAQKNSTS